MHSALLLPGASLEGAQHMTLCGPWRGALLWMQHLQLTTPGVPLLEAQPRTIDRCKVLAEQVGCSLGDWAVSVRSNSEVMPDVALARIHYVCLMLSLPAGTRSPANVVAVMSRGPDGIQTVNLGI